MGISKQNCVCVCVCVCVSVSDLEKAASGAWGLFFKNYAILRTFGVKYPVLLIEDGGRSVEDWEMRLNQGDLR